MSLENPCEMCGLEWGSDNYESCPNCTFNKCNWCFHDWNNYDNIKDKHEKDCHWYDKEDDFNAWV